MTRLDKVENDEVRKRRRDVSDSFSRRISGRQTTCQDVMSEKPLQIGGTYGNVTNRSIQNQRDRWCRKRRMRTSRRIPGIESVSDLRRPTGRST